MSYELDRLMQQYEVNTASPAYGGKVAPVKPTAPGPGASAADVAAYNALVQKYNLDTPQSMSDQTLFDQYKTAYQNKIGAGSIYNQAQFNTSGQPYGGANPAMLAGPAYGSTTYGGQFSPLTEMAAPAAPTAPIVINDNGQGGEGGAGGYTGGQNGGVNTGGITNGTGTGWLGNTMVNGVSGPTTGIYSGLNSLSAFLGNMGLTTLSDAIANRGATGGGVDPQTGLQGQGATGQTGLYGDAAAGMGAPAPTGNIDPGAYEGGFYGPQAFNENAVNMGGGVGAPNFDANARAYADAAAAYAAAPEAVSSPVGTSNEGSFGGGADAPGANADGYGGGDAGFGGNSEAFARGGRVRRKFAEGGLNDLAESYGLSGPPDVYQSTEMNRRLASTPQGAAMMTPMSTPAAAPPPEMDMQALLQRYLPNPVDYSGDIAESRKALSGYNANFNKLLEQAMTQKAAGPSKAELYFNLAAAFGTPGKTGNFFEQLGGAGKALSDYKKAGRENERDQQKTALMLGMKQQEIGAEGERSNLSTLRQLAAEGSKDQRAVVSKLLENYINSGKPQSAAGKQAQDEGFQPGTPAFNKRVAEVGNMLVEKQMAQISAIAAGQGAQTGQLAVAQGNLGVAQGNLALKQAAQKRVTDAGTKLTPGEMKIKLETEDLINQTDQAIGGLEKAYELNPGTFDTSMVDIAQRRALEAVGSKDKKVLDTREQENLLEKAALSQLKATFPGAISNEERKVLMNVQGIGAKSIEERAKIIKSAAKALKGIRARAAERLNKVAAGEYRTAVAAPEPVVGE